MGKIKEIVITNSEEIEIETIIKYKSLEAPFWNYYSDESKHSFYKKGSKEEQEVLDKFFK